MAHKQWEKSLTTLNNWLAAQKTEQVVRTTIIMCLQAWWMEGTDTPQGLGFSTHSQDKLGWNLALEGVLMEQWRTQQEQYWQWIKSRCSAQRWTAELIKTMWKVSWEMWQHHNRTLHKTEARRLLIVEGDMNKQVIQVYKAGAHELLAADLPITRIQLAMIVSGMLMCKQQWLESMAVARVQFKKSYQKDSGNVGLWKTGPERDRHGQTQNT